MNYTDKVNKGSGMITEVDLETYRFRYKPTTKINAGRMEG